MNRIPLRQQIFLALCCDLGLFSKRLIAPVTNVIVDALHIPGGISTSFSLMFLVVAAGLMYFPGCGALMGFIQSVMALAFGMVGSMGLLSPIAYIVPGLVIDCIMLLSRQLCFNRDFSLLTASMLAAVSAGLTANTLVFHLGGLPLALYLSVALTSGALCGTLAGTLVKRLEPMLTLEYRKD